MEFLSRRPWKRSSLDDKETAKFAAQWLLDTKLLPQFRVAEEIDQEDTSGWAPITTEGDENPGD